MPFVPSPRAKREPPPRLKTETGVDLIRSNGVKVGARNRAKRLRSAALQKAFVFEHWMKLYAEWRANAPGKPPQIERAKKASEYAGVKLSRHQIINLEAREEFQDYLRLMIDRTVATYRAKMELTIPHSLEQMEWALKQARATNDYKEVARQCEWVRDRVWPRKSEIDHKVTKVEVVISARRQEMLDDDLDEIVVEAIETEAVVLD